MKNTFILAMVSTILISSGAYARTLICDHEGQTLVISAANFAPRADVEVTLKKNGRIAMRCEDASFSDAHTIGGRVGRGANADGCVIKFDRDYKSASLELFDLSEGGTAVTNFTCEE